MHYYYYFKEELWQPCGTGGGGKEGESFPEHDASDHGPIPSNVHQRGNVHGAGYTARNVRSVSVVVALVDLYLKVDYIEVGYISF